MIEAGVLSKIALEIGPFVIHWYAVIIVTGVILAVLLAIQEGKYQGIATADDVTDFILIAFPLAIVGARAYYVLFNWSYYSQNPSQIIAMWDGGGAIYGSLIVGALVIIFFTRSKKINTWGFLDIAVPGVFLAQAMGRWGNFVNQEAYGDAVSNLNYLPKFIQNQMFIDGSFRQPTFLFESIGTLSGFILVMLLRHRLKFLKKGDIFCFYLIWYGMVRFIVEGMRTDSLTWQGIRVSQALSFFLIIAGFLIIAFKRIAEAKKS